jgi:hypothetical protein
MVDGRDVYRVLVGKTEGKRPLGRPWRRWEDNIKMDLKEAGCGGIDWIELVHERQVAGTCAHHAIRHNTTIHYILSTAPQLSISQKALGTIREDGNVMLKHAGATIHN